MAKTMTKDAAEKALSKKGLKMVVLQCSGYLRFQAHDMNTGAIRATVETTDMTPGQARAALVAKVGQ